MYVKDDPTLSRILFKVSDPAKTVIHPVIYKLSLHQKCQCTKLACIPLSFITMTLVFFNPFPNKPWFLRVRSASHLKTLWEKEKLLVKSNFSFSHSVFYPFGELSTILIKLKIVVCKLFEFGRV